MAICTYMVDIGTAIALSAAATKTILAVKAHANSGLQLHNVRVSFDGVTASWPGAKVEVCELDYGGAGTSTSNTNIRQTNGIRISAGFTSTRNYTAEPTTLTPIWSEYIAPDKGNKMEGIPLGLELDCLNSVGFAIRVTTPSGATPNVLASMLVSRI